MFNRRWSNADTHCLPLTMMCTRSRGTTWVGFDNYESKSPLLPPNGIWLKQQYLQVQQTLNNHRFQVSWWLFGRGATWMKGFVETAFVSFWIQSIARFPGGSASRSNTLCCQYLKKIYIYYPSINCNTPKTEGYYLPKTPLGPLIRKIRTLP